MRTSGSTSSSSISLSSAARPLSSWNQNTHLLPSNIKTAAIIEADSPLNLGLDDEEQVWKGESVGLGFGLLSKSRDHEQGIDSISWDCKICRNTASDPCVTRCGHLFCWSHLREHLTGLESPSCPTCNTPTRMDRDVVQVFGRPKALPPDVPWTTSLDTPASVVASSSQTFNQVYDRYGDGLDSHNSISLNDPVEPLTLHSRSPTSNNPQTEAHGLQLSLQPPSPNASDERRGSIQLPPPPSSPVEGKWFNSRLPNNYSWSSANPQQVHYSSADEAPPWPTRLQPTPMWIPKSRQQRQRPISDPSLESNGAGHITGSGSSACEDEYSRGGVIVEDVSEEDGDKNDGRLPSYGYNRGRDFEFDLDVITPKRRPSVTPAPLVSQAHTSTTTSIPNPLPSPIQPPTPSQRPIEKPHPTSPEKTFTQYQPSEEPLLHQPIRLRTRALRPGQPLRARFAPLPFPTAHDASSDSEVNAGSAGEEDNELLSPITPTLTTSTKSTSSSSLRGGFGFAHHYYTSKLKPRANRRTSSSRKAFRGFDYEYEGEGEDGEDEERKENGAGASRWRRIRRGKLGLGRTRASSASSIISKPGAEGEDGHNTLSHLLSFAAFVLLLMVILK